MRRQARTLQIWLTLALLLGIVIPTALAQPTQNLRAMPGQPTTLSFYGINGYFSGYERPTDEVNALLPLGPAVGMRWTREEIVWANIEPFRGTFHFDFPDDRLWRIAHAGYGVIGMLLTTPPWARKPACSDNYWCPPLNPADYQNFVAAVVERYDGDGEDDAPGSPRVAYWEIWNEPNHPETWPGSPGEYAALLKAGYEGVKGADPTAQVLVGSVYVLDGVSGWPPAYDGIAFLESVLEADGEAWNAFDIVGIHPHMPDTAPDQPGLYEPVTMLARLDHALDWVQRHGGGKQVWVTEVGWSTCSADQGDCRKDLSKTEDQQANYLLRTHAMALSKGIAHLSTFQLEDKFDGAQSAMWGGCSLIQTAAQGYAPKKAYYAYAVFVAQLADAVYVGPGPLYTLTWSWETGLQRLSAQTRFDYRFGTPDNGHVDVLWRPDEQSEIVAFPVGDGWTITWVERDGQEHHLTPVNGYVSFAIDGRPGYLRQVPPPILRLSTTEIGFLTTPGAAQPDNYLYVDNAGGGTLTWTLSILRGSEWFSASPSSGTAPSTITVRLVTPPLATGLFTGTLSVDSGAAGRNDVSLWVRVVPSLKHLYMPLIRRGASLSPP